MLRQNGSKSGAYNGPNASGSDAFSSDVSSRQGGNDANADAEASAKIGEGDESNMRERVASLEKALSVARAEQDALKAELERARHQVHLYEATAGEHRIPVSPHTPRTPPQSSSTHSKPDLEASPRRSLNGSDQSVLEQNYELRRQVANLQTQLSDQDTTYRTAIDDHRRSRHAEWNDLTARLHYAEKESQERLQQLQDLKQSISALTRVESQVSDGELVERVDKLYHRIREWVVSNFRRSKLTQDRVPAETAKVLHRIYRGYLKLKAGDRLPLYQSIVAYALMEIFEESLVVGLPQTGPLAPIRQLAAYIQGTGAEFGEWRRATIRALENSHMRDTLREEQARKIHQLSNDIEHQLFCLTSTQLAPNAKSELLAIVRRTADLQNALLLQKAHYRLHFFSHQGDKRIFFDDRRMEPVNDIDDGTDEHGQVATKRTFGFCVFPCVEKFGDEFGDTNDIRNVLLRARVWSAPLSDEPVGL